MKSTPSVFLHFKRKPAKKNVSLRGGTTKQSAKLITKTPSLIYFHNVNFNEKTSFENATDCFVVPPRKDTLILGFGFAGMV
jgi:hypothetical protein